MSTIIRTSLDSLNITLTNKMITEIESMVIGWELRRTHPIALNSQTLGVHPIAFTTEDRAAFFTIIGVDESDLKTLIQKIPSINQDHIVRKDPFNILSVWLIHLAYRQISDKTKREQFQIAVAKYLHYRFFTSLVNYYFSHGAVEKTMLAAVNGLSRKFDLVTYGTWKAVIEARCHDLLSASSIHRPALENANDDEMYLRIIQDLQTRIRDKVKNITAAYYEARSSGDSIASRRSTIETENGMELVQNTRTLDTMIYNLQTEVMSARLFIDDELVRKLSDQFKAISPNMFRSVLRALVEIAETQRDTKQLDLIKTNDGLPLYVGIRALLTNLIQKTYRYCMHNGVDITNTVAVYVKVKNIYGSSRTSDTDILAVKQSVAYLIDLISTSRREPTNSSLRICLVLYIMTRSFRFM